MTQAYDSLLILTPLSGTAFLLPPFSSRDLSQTLDPISGISGAGGNVLGSWIRRDINGNLVNLVPSQFKKYQSEITCKDIRSPALDDGWIGQLLEVQCAMELSYVSGGTPARSVVSGSERTVGHFIFYRPLLTMMVVGIVNGFAEYPHEYSWKMSLQE